MKLDDNITTIILVLIFMGFMGLTLIASSGFGWLIPFGIGLAIGWIGKKFYDKKKKL